MSSDLSFSYGASVHHAVDNAHYSPAEIQLFERILDSVDRICFIVSSDGTQMHFVNKPAEQLLGYSHDELIRMSVKAVVSPSSLSDICGLIKKNVASNKSESGSIECAPYPIELVKKDRTLLPGMITCTLQMVNQDTVGQIGGTIRLPREATAKVSVTEVDGNSSQVDVVSSTEDEPECKEKVLNSFPGKILIMDDEEILIDIALQMGKRIGLIVETAGNGGEAIKMYKDAMESDYPYDAVLLDMTIAGGMGGIETAKELRKIDCNVMTIVMSGYSDHEVMAKPADYGFAGVISKPFRLNEFSKVLHEVIPEEKFQNGTHS